MDLEYLRTFISVVKTKNFTKSAEALHVAQSTITSRIQSLEAEIGKPLFRRNNKQVILTQAGITFLPFAERILALYHEGKEMLDYQQQYNARVVLGGPTSAWHYIFCEQLVEFQSRHPDVACELLTHSSENTVEKVIDGIIHLGITYTKPRHPMLEVHPLIEDDYVFVARQTWDRKLTVEDLYHSHFVLNDWGKPFLDWFYHEMGGEKYIPALKINQTTILIKLCLEQDRFTFIPESIIKKYIERGDLYILEHTLPWSFPKHPVYAVHLKNEKGNMREYINELLSCFPNKKER